MLLDPVTGDVRLAPGEVRPLVQQLMRPLQRAGQDHEFWAALPDRKNDLTVVGIYDSRVFGFKPVITIKGILFNSMQMWVDKPGGHVLFAYKGHLLSVPVDQ